jgi:hypothetical protein
LFLGIGSMKGTSEKERGEQNGTHDRIILRRAASADAGGVS